MAFEPGHKKLGGKVAGTPNRTSRSLIAQMEEYGMGTTHDHPVMWMYKVAHGLVKISRVIEGAEMETVATPELRVTCMKEVAKYVSPQLKAIEHSGEMTNNVTFLEPLDRDI